MTGFYPKLFTVLEINLRHMYLLKYVSTDHPRTCLVAQIIALWQSIRGFYGYSDGHTYVVWPRYVDSDSMDTLDQPWSYKVRTRHEDPFDKVSADSMDTLINLGQIYYGQDMRTSFDKVSMESDQHWIYLCSMAKRWIPFWQSIHGDSMDTLTDLGHT